MVNESVFFMKGYFS